jgi:hypothetical protein
MPVAITQCSVYTPRFTGNFSKNHPIGLTPVEHRVATVMAGLSPDTATSIPTGRGLETHRQNIGHKVYSFCGNVATADALDDATRVQLTQTYQALQKAKCATRAMIVEETLQKYPVLLLGQSLPAQVPIVAISKCPVALTSQQKEIALELRDGTPVLFRSARSKGNHETQLGQVLLPAVEQAVPDLIPQVKAVQHAQTVTKGKLFRALLRQLPEDWFH